MMEKDYYDIVFVVLVYKNIEVLSDFFSSLHISSTYKVIVVNSFYDERTERECSRVASANDADYIPTPNLGYGSGNNLGCQYAIEHYMYQYLIVSNSDIIINNLDNIKELKDKRAVYAPDTRIKGGHRQNPNIPFESCLYLRLMDWAYVHDNSIVMRIAQAVNRINRELAFGCMKILKRKVLKIFAPHGSFIIFTYQASLDLMPVFLKEMFLYNEELYLAYHCQGKGIPIYYVPELKITHLDGASATRADHHEGRNSYLVLKSWMQKGTYR